MQALKGLSGLSGLLGPAGGGPSTLLNNLAAYWTLDEASGTRSDSVGTSHLTATNSPTSAAGKQGNAVQLVSASSQYLSVAENAAIDVSGQQDFTLAGWVYFDTLPVNVGGFIGQWGDDTSINQRAYLLHRNNSTIQFFVSGDGANSISVTSATLTTATWYCVVAWHDAAGDTVNLQINNGTTTSAAYAGGIFNSTSPFILGRRDRAIDNSHNGRLDEFGLWKRVLTDTERTALYNSGNGRTYPFVGT